MSIRVIGANHRKYPAEMVLQAAVNRRIKDVPGENYKALGIPLEIIYLDWNPGKKCAHQTKTKGDFHNTFITRKSGGGLQVQYKNPGCLEWLKDGLTGTLSAMVSRTPNNMRLLASMFYDNLWTVRDPGVRGEIKKAADLIDEENKKVPYNYKKIVKEFDEAAGAYFNKEVDVKGTMYGFHKERREGHLKDRYAGEMTAPLGGFLEKQGLNREKEAIENEKRNLEEREQRIFQKEKDLQIVVDVIPDQEFAGTPTPEYSEQELIDMKKQNFGKLRKLARDKFGVVDAFKMHFEEIRDAIMKKQNETAEEEIITS